MKKIPISTQSIIYVKGGRILLLQRKDNPLYWQSITGSIEVNENPRECAIREIMEETGLDANKHHFFSLLDTSQYQIFPEWRPRYSDNVFTNIEHLFALQLKKEENIVLNKDEHLKYQWVSIEEAIKKVFSWTNRNALINFKNIYE